MRFDSFGEAEAWVLGVAMRDLADAQKLPLVIDIRIGRRRFFFTALPVLPGTIRSGRGAR